MWLVIVSSVMYGFAKNSNGRIFFEHPGIATGLNVARFIALISVIGNAHMAMPVIIKGIVSLYIAQFLGKGIYKVISGN